LPVWANRYNPPVADADIAVACGRACAVDDLGITDQQVEHSPS
jgi:hypothetical protein